MTGAAVVCGHRAYLAEVVLQYRPPPCVRDRPRARRALLIALERLDADHSALVVVGDEAQWVVGQCCLREVTVVALRNSHAAAGAEEEREPLNLVARQSRDCCVLAVDADTG